MQVPRKIGLKRGDRGKEVRKLQEYLRTFGYILPDNGVILGRQIDPERAAQKPKRGVFDGNTEGALKLFQTFYKLPVTGILDRRTISLMSRPRCERSRYCGWKKN